MNNPLEAPMTARPGLFIPVSLLILLACSCGARTRPPSFILVSLDTTRADRLGIMGYERNATPFLDTLGRKGIVFEQAATVSTNTLIAHASMLTGLFSNAHGATPMNEPAPLHEAYSTLAEDFARAGYQTAGFAAHGDWLNAHFGIDQGFETFGTGYRPAEAVLEEARRWLADRDENRPYFLFIHLFDVHSDFKDRPYDSPPPFKGSYTRDYQGPLKSWEGRVLNGSQFLLAVHKRIIEITPEDLRFLSDQYDEGLAYTDDRLGGFLDSLDGLEDTFIIVTADHGEEFQEHGGMLHNSYYDPVLHVPLILVPPPGRRGSLGAPGRIPEEVCIVDLRPTLLALAGLPEPLSCQGKNLLPWLEGRDEACPSGPVHFLDYSGLRFQGYKLLKTGNGLELYDLGKDPEERRDLSRSEGMWKVVQSMVHLLDEQEKTDLLIREEHHRQAGRRKPGQDPGAAERLRRLGYSR